MNRRVLLVVGVLLVLLFPSTSFQHSDAIGQVTVLSERVYEDSIGYYHIVGELHNGVDRAVERVKIVATIYDSDNSVLATSIGFSDVEVLRPGEKSSFSILFSGEDSISGNVGLHKLDISWDVASEEKPAMLQLKVGNDYVDNIGFYHLVGEVSNLGPLTAHYVEVDAALYDSEGQILYTGLTFTDVSDISAGKKAPFDILVSGSDVEQIAEVSVNVQSEEYAMIISDPSEDEPAVPAQSDLTILLGDDQIEKSETMTLKGKIIGFDTNQPRVSINILSPDNKVYDGFTIQANSDGSFERDYIWYGKAGYENKIFKVVAKYNTAQAQAEFTYYVPSTEEPEPEEPPTTATPTENTGVNTVSLKPISFSDMNDNPISEVAEDSMILITTTVTNNNPKTQPFTVLIEVRDESDVTVSIQVQKGTLNPNGSTQVGVSWQPEEEGNYTIRTIVVASLKSPDLLSALQEKSVDVQG